MQVDSSETRPGSTPPAPSDFGRFAPGTLLADRYRIVALVGQGGMGEVYRAEDLRLGQTVALKFLPAALEQDLGARERLLAEVRNARTVSHPNVCRVYDVGEVSSPSARPAGSPAGGAGRARAFLTMEYIDGEDLASLLRRIGRVPAPKALEIARQLCAGLAAAHDKGVLHRDLKPANIMIDGRGRARITDFGLAVEAVSSDAGGRAPAQQSVSDFAGTIAYMAPERFLGKPATIQSDLYALGLILYEAYTGKPAVLPAGVAPRGPTVGDWQRAHTDRTPSTPSSHVSEIEPAVERAILRCLEKDPAKRPASAAQVAAALPGGDPLAAAIAAGETPSPELVAASGEEGTMTRTRAWLSLAVVVVALALVVPLLGSLELVNLVSWDQTPAELCSEARKILRDVGYRSTPADSTWRVDHSMEYLAYLGRLQPASRRFTDPATAVGGPLLFWYRQSPAPLRAGGIYGAVGPNDPPRLDPEDASLTFHPSGRLVRLTVVPPVFSDAPAGGDAEGWPDRLFQAARLDRKQFQPVAPRWTPPVFVDSRVAWEGPQSGALVRVEAAASGGRPVFFRVISPWEGTSEGRLAKATTASAALIAFVCLLTVGMLVVLALLARRNVRLGRGDRKGALRLALCVFVMEFAFCLLYRHWTFQPLVVVITFFLGQGIPFFAAGSTWLYYLGLEPYVRRRWPHLLVASTRLLDGRWRDPLVGRSLFAGIAAGLAVHVLSALSLGVGVLLNLRDVIPFYAVDSLNVLGWFLAEPAAPNVAPALAMMPITILLIARLALGRDRAAWVALAVLMFVLELFALFLISPIWYPSLPAFILPAAFFTTVIVFTLWKSGVLASAVMFFVAGALDCTPLTTDFSRWYAWRTVVVVGIVLGLALWGFRNVLGRQPAFATSALDE